MKQSDVDLLKSLLIKKSKMKSENGVLEIDNTADGLKARMISIEANKLYQDSREGYNLLKNELNSQTINGGTITVYDDGSYSLNGTFTSPVTLIYTNTSLKLSGDYVFYLYGKTSKKGINLQGKENGSTVSYILSSSNSEYLNKNYSEETELTQLFSYIPVGASFNNDLFKPMITKGTEIKEFQKYGQKPSLEEESEIEGITGDIELKLNNTNFLDESKLVEKTQLGIISKIENKKITYSGTCTGSGAVLVNSIPIELDIGEYYLNWFGVHKNPYFTLRKQDSTFLQNLVGSPTSNTKITIEEKDTYLIGLHGIAGQTYTSEDTSFNLMLSKKNSVNYAEYKSKDYTISIDSKVLYGNEDVKDMIILKDGKWNWKNCWKKYILDGTEFNFIVKSDSILNNVFFSKTITNILAPKNNNGVIKIYSNYFANNTYVNKLVLEDIVGFGVAKDSRIQFGFGLNSEINSLELANAKLQELNASGHPLYVIYQLAEPEYEEITDETLISQLNKLLYQLKEYDDVTYINSDKEIEFEVLVEQDKLSILEKGGNENE